MEMMRARHAEAMRRLAKEQLEPFRRRTQGPQAAAQERRALWEAQRAAERAESERHLEACEGMEEEVFLLCGAAERERREALERAEAEAAARDPDRAARARRAAKLEASERAQRASLRRRNEAEKAELRAERERRMGELWAEHRAEQEARLSRSQLLTIDQPEETAAFERRLKWERELLWERHERAEAPLHARIERAKREAERLAKDLPDALRSEYADLRAKQYDEEQSLRREHVRRREAHDAAQAAARSEAARLDREQPKALAGEDPAHGGGAGARVGARRAGGGEGGGRGGGGHGPDAAAERDRRAQAEEAAAVAAFLRGGSLPAAAAGVGPAGGESAGTRDSARGPAAGTEATYLERTLVTVALPRDGALPIRLGPCAAGPGAAGGACGAGDLTLRPPARRRGGGGTRTMLLDSPIEADYAAAGAPEGMPGLARTRTRYVQIESFPVPLGDDHDTVQWNGVMENV
jgi:hypothetical protein